MQQVVSDAITRQMCNSEALFTYWLMKKSIVLSGRCTHYMRHATGRYAKRENMKFFGIENLEWATFRNRLISRYFQWDLTSRNSYYLDESLQRFWIYWNIRFSQQFSTTLSLLNCAHFVFMQIHIHDDFKFASSHL